MNSKDCFKLYSEMLFIRHVEEMIVKKYHEQKMRCPVHLSIGQEAAAVGVCHALLKKDRIFSNHRSHGHYLAKKGDLKRMLAEIYGKYAGCCGGRGGSMHLFDKSQNITASVPLVSSSIALAVGSALSSKIDNSKEVTVSFLGDGSVEEGIFHESLNFASINKLPIIFVCENNLYSVYTPINERQPVRPFNKLGEAHAVKSYICDGNDVLKIYEITKKLVKNSRLNKGPFFLTLNTYRHREHCGPNYDNTIGYRTEKEFKLWKKKDPIINLKKKLINNYHFNEKQFDQLSIKLNKSINKAFNFAEKSKLPTPELIDKYIYAQS
ncbi:thiamine pyrophosphate-dependent dehydrogenase E1 component subunit alpha [Candidatus Pelagibacter sp.]|nr:thiamine pyrophosphate-dependent dehydrogenase E1 component subunit alpha [Candidatus Pelagibacter sp.]MDB4081470.1 thiamine pyrophosphate-dependent dehydrogenase E1 component subunit alpha [Candidatus Pelagibacter sp.]